MDKQALRLQFRRRRSEVLEPSKTSLLAARNITQTAKWRSAKTVLLYHAVGSEIDTSLLISSALTENKTTLLPVTIDKSGEMGVGIITSVDNLSAGHFSIPEPELDATFDFSKIDLVIVPGVAFDNSGGRLGQGGGYYDRFLARCNAIKIGYCFNNQISDSIIPSETHDIKMDYIITEREVINCIG